MARRWILSISILSLILLCGFLPVQGMVNSFYVIIPYACSLVCAAMLLWGVIQISDGEKGLREYVYKSVVGQLPIRAAATGIFAGLTLVGEGIFLFREGAAGTDVAATALFCLAEGAVLVMSLICRRMEKDILWGK